jgi:hypothetical protein
MEELKINKAIDVIPLRESFDYPFLMIGRPALDVISNSRVQIEGSARHDVNVIAFFSSQCRSLASLGMTSF